MIFHLFLEGTFKINLLVLSNIIPKHMQFCIVILDSHNIGCFMLFLSHLDIWQMIYSLAGSLNRVVEHWRCLDHQQKRQFCSLD